VKTIRSLFIHKTISGLNITTGGLDIRTKLFIVALFSTLGICYQNIEILLCLLFANIIINLTLRVSFNVRGLNKIIYLTCSLMIIQSFFIRGGDPFISFMGINLLTTSGVLYGIRLLLRTYIILTSSLIILSCNSNELASGLIKLKIPYEIVFMLQLATRFLPKFLEEIQTTIYAIQLRGVNLKKVYRRDVLNIYIKIFIPIVCSALQKAEKLSVTAELRGFRYQKQRSLYRDTKINNRDYAVIIFIILSLFVILFFI
jgi:energy-coupling factor transport system permease protein